MRTTPVQYSYNPVITTIPKSKHHSCEPHLFSTLGQIAGAGMKLSWTSSLLVALDLAFLTTLEMASPSERRKPSEDRIRVRARRRT